MHHKQIEHRAKLGTGALNVPRTKTIEQAFDLDFDTPQIELEDDQSLREHDMFNKEQW